MYLLDTNFCSALLRNAPEIVDRLRRLRGEGVFTCEIVRGELAFMVALSERVEANASRLDSLFSDLPVLPVGPDEAAEYGKLKAAIIRRHGPRGRRKSVPVTRLGFSDNDLWIAAVALARGLTVLSGDGDFSRMREAEPRLRVESWIGG